MSGKLIARRDDGSLEAVPLMESIRIEGGEYWIREAGGAVLAVNGEHVSAKRKLRHLDVITVGANVNMIFSTAAIELPVSRPVKRAAAMPPAASSAAPPPVTMVFRASEIDVPELDQSDAAPVNTMLGVPPAAIPAFQASEATPNTLELVRGAAPQFPVTAQESSPANTMEVQVPPKAPPKFEPAPAGEPPPSELETVIQRIVTPPPRTPALGRAITSVELRGITGVLMAPRGRSVIGRGSQATIRIDSEGVSKVHAVLVVTPIEVILTDQNSVNGTTVNGRAISQPQKLNDGDRVAFAKVDYRVQFIKGSGVR